MSEAYLPNGLGIALITAGTLSPLELHWQIRAEPIPAPNSHLPGCPRQFLHSPPHSLRPAHELVLPPAGALHSQVGFPSLVLPVDLQISPFPPAPQKPVSHPRTHLPSFWAHESLHENSGGPDVTVAAADGVAPGVCATPTEVHDMSTAITTAICFTTDIRI